MQFNKHKYQEKAINFIDLNQKVFLVLDMGLGKTAITLTALKNLLDEFMVRNILVIAPKRVANHVWPDELKKWDHLSNISFSQFLSSTFCRVFTALIRSRRVSGILSE